MKKALLASLLIFYCIFSLFSEPFYIKENFETMNFEIYVNDKKTVELPFRIYCGYQIFDDNVYFIDCLNSRIEEYGELCIFDTKQKNLKYLNIMTGSSFLCYKNYLITTSLTEPKQESDIEDILYWGIPSKQYPLNISIYNLQTLKKLKDINLEEYRHNFENNSLYLNINVDSNERIELYYSILDTTEVINIGYLNLDLLEIQKYN